MIYLNGRQQLFTRLPAINKLSFWNGTGIQKVVSDKIKKKSLPISSTILVHRMPQEQLSVGRYRGRQSLAHTSSLK